MKSKFENIKVDNLFVFIYISFLVFYVFFWNAIGLGYGKAYLVFYLIFIGYELGKARRGQFTTKKLLRVLLILLFLIIMSIPNFHFNVFYTNVVKFILPAVLNVYFILNISTNVVNNAQKGKCVVLFWYALNVYFWINIPIIFIQRQGTFFMMNRRIINTLGRVMYEDHITGLIGLSGTHILVMYWVVLLSLNLLVIKKINNKRKIFQIINCLLEMVFMTYISSINDNNFFYFFVPIMLFIYLFVLAGCNIKNRSFQRTVIISGICFLLFVIGGYFLVPSIKNIIDNRIIPLFLVYFGLSGDKYPVGANERVYLVQYAWKNIDNVFLGNGLGSVMMQYPVNMPNHFGMNDVSSLLYIGGIVSLVLLIGLLFKMSLCITKINRLSFKIMLICIIILLFFYTNIISYMPLTILYAVEMVLIKAAFNGGGSKREEDNEKIQNGIYR